MQNLVVHFYLAIENGRYGDAYPCLDPAYRAAHLFDAFRRGFATTYSSRLIIADLTAAGDVFIDLQAVDRVGGGLVAATFMGTWRVGNGGTLLQSRIQRVRRMAVPAVLPTGIADASAFDTVGEATSEHERPPAGTRWRVVITVPDRTRRHDRRGTAARRATPLGEYHLIGFFAGMDGPCAVTAGIAGTAAIRAAALTIVP